MTVKDVLIADWTVNKIDIIVRDTATTRFLAEYHIGQNLDISHHLRFVRETKAGTLYETGGMRHLFMERIIQHRDLLEKRKGEEGCVGVLIKNIPEELLNLLVEHMRPYGCGRSDGMHGYRFECYTGMWFGVPGEQELAEEEQ